MRSGTLVHMATSALSMSPATSAQAWRAGMATRSGLAPLANAVRSAIRPGDDSATTARLVAGQLRRHLPTPDLLTPEQRLGDPSTYAQHVLYVEPGGAFSIVAVVWRPGQVTPIHDHVSWCVVGVIEGS